MRKPRIKCKGIGYPAPNPVQNKYKQADPKRKDYKWEKKGKRDE